MAEANELKESVKDSVKNLVKEIIGDIIYKIVKMSTKRAVKELKEELKEKTIHRLERRLKDVAEQRLEKQLNESVKQVAKEIVEDSPERVNFISEIERGFEKGFEKYLSSLKGLIPFKPIVITCVCLLVVGGGVFALVNPPSPAPAPAPFPPPPPPPKAKPDLVIREVWHEWTEKGAMIYYVIQNQGKEKAGSSTTYLYLGDRLLIKDAVDPLSPGQISKETFSPHPFSQAGFKIELGTDGDNRIDESNEENNGRSYTVKPVAKPDLVITKIWHRADPKTGDITIYYVIENRGKEEVGPSTTYLYLDGRLFLEDPVGRLPPGETRTESFSAYQLSPGHFHIKLCADGDNRIRESDEENNYASYEYIAERVKVE